MREHKRGLQMYFNWYPLRIQAEIPIRVEITRSGPNIPAAAIEDN